ncbi:MAG: DUF302 domain-containing protein [Methylotenera sp.]|nr:DUF302 domain-containing protein [Oligoflexia bacterium]
MRKINFKTTVSGNFDEVIARVTDELKQQGFGVLSRIDLHQKFLEKLGKKIPPAVILGACNPQLAYDAYQSNSDVASLLPCNAVVREIAPGSCSVEFARPSAMMEILGDKQLVTLSQDADRKLETCLKRLSEKSAA